jgi:hypothetical protein
MAYTTVNKHSSLVKPLTYTGNYSTNAITGVGFSPNTVWIKDTGDTSSHSVFDTTQGINKRWQPGSNASQGVESNYLNSFDSDGFTVGANNATNQSGVKQASWCWKAGTSSGLSGGDITPSAYSINTTAKFGIYKYTGNGTSGATIAHGLGGTPACIWIKALSRADDTVIGHHMLNGGTNPWNYHFKLRASSRSQTSSSAYFNNTAPTSSVFSLGNDTGVNNNGDTYVAYVWCEVPGFSKFGEYYSSGNSNGPYTNLGFRPEMLIIASRDSDDEVEMYDSVRNGYNDANYHLNFNLNTAEDTNSGRLHLLSTGFKIKVGPSGPINSGSANSKYIYMAWGQSLVGSNNIPCTAR